jgi:ribosomal protein S18 acetylase RimI-like enzyme
MYYEITEEEKEMKANTSEAIERLLIRDFRQGDLEGYLQCLKKSFVEEFEVEGHDPDFWRKMVRRRFKLSGKIFFLFLRLLRREPFKLFVADVNGMVSGATMTSIDGKIGYISSLMVHPDFRRKGLGAKLMNTTLNYIKKRKSTRAVLHVRLNNQAAKSLYHKLGFVKFEDVTHLTGEIDSLLATKKTETVQIRDFDEKRDIDDVYELMKSSLDPVHLRVYDFKKKDLETSLVERVIHFSTVRRFLAIRDEKVIGYVRSSYTSNKEAGAIHLYVPSEMPSEEVVEMLVKAGLDHIKSIGTKTVLTTVPSTKRELIHALKKLGFRERIAFEGMVLEF